MVLQKHVLLEGHVMYKNDYVITSLSSLEI